MDNPERIFYYLWLSNIPGVSARNVFLLLGAFKCAENVWNASYDEIVSRGFSQAIAKLVSKAKSKDTTNKLIEELTEKKISCICIDSQDYPDDLRNIYSPPIVLYIRGNLPDGSIPAVSIIGTRRCSEYGANTAYLFAKEIAKAGVTVISGMAAGIDSIAHKGALAGGGKTVAVLGCGVDICYPSENGRLMDEIIKNGCVLSEYPPGTRPFQGNFPARNRIISGMSKAVLVVEAGVKSGTLITVDHALEQGRDVFAVPGNVTSNNSSGTNALIMQGAAMVTSPQDVLDGISFMKRVCTPVSEEYSKNVLAELDEDERTVYGYIGGEPTHIEAISEKTGYSVPTLTYILTCLELKIMIKKLPGNRYIRI